HAGHYYRERCQEPMNIVCLPIIANLPNHLPVNSDKRSHDSNLQWTVVRVHPGDSIQCLIEYHCVNHEQAGLSHNSSFSEDEEVSIVDLVHPAHPVLGQVLSLDGIVASQANSRPRMRIEHLPGDPR